ncbi:MAG: hypothetical protein ACTSQL_12855 [Promethearchaeota archaeon]
MKPEESIANQYLLGLGLGQVVFEPDGNIPPDFSIGETIGVEVRRLNQQYFGSSDPEGLEQLSFRLWDLIEKEISKFDSKYNGITYFIGVEYHRPYNESAKSTSKSIREELHNFLLSGVPTPTDLPINTTLLFSMYSASPVPGRTFILAGGLDHDSGGAILPMYIDNINYCIEQKSKKIEPYFNKYEEWWLLLVDVMGWGLDIKDNAFVKSKINSLKNFNRMLIIRYGDGQFLLDMDQQYAA